ncbi:MAG: di-heme enzyme [Bryobacteraceae bacterium]|nr:di-heme enzyme [Bryobacteraceae bacterium]
MAVLTAFSVSLAADWKWDLPRGFAPPPVPDDNPMTIAKVELGRHLFYDRRMSSNGTQSCGTCHEQRLAFSDGWPRGIGSTGEVHHRSSMPLANVAYLASLTWADPGMTRLEAQAAVPMFGNQPVELGLQQRTPPFVRVIREDARYRRLFPAAFPGEADPFHYENITRALASFERTLISGRSAYDRYRQGESPALTESARRGEALFSSNRLKCAACHNGIHFTNGAFENTGLYDEYRPENSGLKRITGKAEDEGRFRVPSLRNVALTAPYMHDGSVNTLDEVLDHYQAGGRAATHRNKNPLLTGFSLTREERRDLIAFLRSLTDHEFVSDRRLADPWDN